MQALPRAFYDRDTSLVAHELLGKLLVHRFNGSELIGKIVEVEAYLGPHDLAAHTSKGITPRTQVMFGPPGHVYVYLIYGMHHCMNVVTEADGTGAAVLLRALEPVSGLTVNASGPGRLCKAMGIDKSHYGHDLCSSSLFITEDPAAMPIDIAERPRVGVDYAGEWADKPLRFYIRGNSYISKK
ncbi:DNA-3-methyladenine glycosylase [Pollutimonas harenae]|uniref:Putative 3-methyladenine DNA glycosylase n=1 Tax=Pollutimonas harenae TaxID=657015 RepID=A0A853H5Q6_9BURK|nr:DNA-3-methyladenine glycosylase [Pollutimonas harenae]NYT86505.1 DNA-3-methyladenine glycosylase [Pollutimonas harenae]TEA69751.1 DNA-3-methyladenine glycosylase [Pollutimonas harenae]